MNKLHTFKVLEGASNKLSGRMPADTLQKKLDLAGATNSAVRSRHGGGKAEGKWITYSLITYTLRLCALTYCIKHTHIDIT